MSKPKMSSVYLSEAARMQLQKEARSQRRSLSAVVQLRVQHSLMVEPGPLPADVVAKLMQAQEEGK